MGGGSHTKGQGNVAPTLHSPFSLTLNLSVFKKGEGKSRKSILGFKVKGRDPMADPRTHRLLSSLEYVISGFRVSMFSLVTLLMMMMRVGEGE